MQINIILCTGIPIHTNPALMLLIFNKQKGLKTGFQTAYKGLPAPFT